MQNNNIQELDAAIKEFCDQSLPENICQIVEDVNHPIAANESQQAFAQTIEFAQDWFADAVEIAEFEKDSIASLITRWRTDENNHLVETGLFEIPNDLLLEKINRTIAGTSLVVLNECESPESSSLFEISWVQDNALDGTGYWTEDDSNKFSLKEVIYDCAIMDGEFTSDQANGIATQLLKDLKQGTFYLPRLPFESNDGYKTTWSFQQAGDKPIDFVKISDEEEDDSCFHEATIEDSVPSLAVLLRSAEKVCIEHHTNGNNEAIQGFELLKQIMNCRTSKGFSSLIETHSDCDCDVLEQEKERVLNLINKFTKTLGVPSEIVAWALARILILAFFNGQNDREQPKQLLNLLVHSPKWINSK